MFFHLHQSMHLLQMTEITHEEHYAHAYIYGTLVNLKHGRSNVSANNGACFSIGGEVKVKQKLCSQHFCGMFAGSFGDIQATKHARDFFHALWHPVARSANGFVHPSVWKHANADCHATQPAAGESRTQHLIMLTQAPQISCPRPRRDPTTNADIHLVKHQHRHRCHLRYRHLQGEADARQFATRCNLVQRSRLHAPDWPIPETRSAPVRW